MRIIAMLVRKYRFYALLSYLENRFRAGMLSSSLEHLAYKPRWSFCFRCLSWSVSTVV